MLEKILNLVTVGSSLASAGIVQRHITAALQNLIAWVACILALFVMLVSALIMVYFAMIHYGVDPAVAGMELCALAFALASLVVVLAVFHLRAGKKILQPDLKSEQGLPDIRTMIVAFMNGFSQAKK